MNPHIYDVLPEEKRSVRVSSNVNTSTMAYKDLKIEMNWFWKTELGKNMKQEKQDPEDKVISLNTVERKQKQGQVFQGNVQQMYKKWSQSIRFMGKQK